MTGARVALITVNYGKGAATRELLRTVAALRGAAECRVVVVDNASTDGSRAEVAQAAAVLGDRATVLTTPDNLYYLGGAAFGLRSEYPDLAALPAWVVVCNNDLEFQDPAFLERLLARDPERYGVIGPAIVSAVTGRDQNPFRRRPQGPVERMKWRAYFTSYALARVLLLAYALRMWMLALLPRPSSPPAGEARAATGPEAPIYAAHGACLIFSRTFFQRGGGLDVAARMYAEETSVAETARRLGLPVTYCPDLRVVHREHGTVGARLTKARYALEREAHLHCLAAYG